MMKGIAAGDDGLRQLVDEQRQFADVGRK